MTELYFILGCCLAMAIFVAWKQTRPGYDLESKSDL
jgi:hypothetical protein